MRQRFGWPVLVGVALAGVVALLAAGAAPAAASPAPSGTARAGCRSGRLVTVRISDLPAGVGANAVLFGPRRLRLALHGGRSVCLRAGAYELVARPVRVGKGRIAYPSGASGPLTVQSARFRVPPRAPLVLTVSYEDVAPDTTLVLPAGSAVVPRGRQLLLQYGAFAVHRTSATAALRVGDIVVEPVGRGVPQGLLGRVTSVARGPRTLSLRTVRVSPFEAFTRASLTITLRRRRFTQILHYPARGAQVRLLPRQGTTLGCGPSVQDLSGTASLSFAPGGFLSLSFSDPDWFDPQVNGSFSISPGLSVGATLSATEGVNCSITQDLGTVPLGTYCTDFGCFTLNLVGTASLSVGVAQPFSESFSESLNGSIGASFRFGVVTPSFTPQDSLALTGSLSGSQQPDAWQGSITAGIGPALQVLYGIPGVAGVGPQLGAQDQLTLAGDPSGWNLSGGVGGSVGVALDLAGFSYSNDYSFPIASQTLASGEWNPVPSAPLGPTVTGASTSSLTVGWQPPSYAGSGITSYTVSWATPQGPCPASPPSQNTQTVSSTGALITGLTAGTPYTVCVYANSGAYTGPPAQTGGTTIEPSPPGAPVITSASTSYDPTSGGPVESVGFNVPYNGGSPIQSFTATWVGDGTSGSYTVADGCPSCATYQIMFPLPAFLPSSTVNGTTVYPYRVTVYATNGAGPGAPSDARSFAAVVPAPPPVDISATAGPMTIGGVSGPGVAVQWQPPATDGGEPIGTYVVELFGSGLPSGGEDYDCFQQVNDCNEPPGLTAAQIALPASAYGNRYTLQMFSVNGVGLSVLTSPPLTFIPIRPPDAPAHIGASVDPGPPRAFRVSWAPPGYDGGSPIISYTVGWSGLGESRVIQVSASARSATVPLPSTTTAAPFKVFVLAANAAGLGPAKVTTVQVPASCPRPHFCSTGGPRPRPVR